MSVSLYMDENVEEAITEGLRRRGVDVLRVQDDGRRETPDPEILDRAAELGRVMFTRDDDFLVEASRRQEAGEPFVGVIYVHKDALVVGRCVIDLEVIARVNTPEDHADRVVYLPL